MTAAASKPASSAYPMVKYAGELCAVIAGTGIWALQPSGEMGGALLSAHQAELLEPSAKRYLDDKAQRKAIDLADGWPQAQPNDAHC